MRWEPPRSLHAPLRQERLNKETTTVPGGAGGSRGRGEGWGGTRGGGRVQREDSFAYGKAGLGGSLLLSPEDGR